jgi:aldose sugar dehydrogenase
LFSKFKSYTNFYYTDHIVVFFQIDRDANESLKNRVYKYQWNEEEKLLVNPKLILDLPAIPGPNHDGGKLAIGPDNYLYAVIEILIMMVNYKIL